jgi:CubicO group peptidase (beta-lactamase class C family)
MDVANEFEKNFREREEVGASVCITHEGRTVLDLWGGLVRPGDAAPWQRDTVSIVFSCTKGAVALCAHVLASRGALDIDAPVSAYWPEFARKGKESATVRDARPLRRAARVQDPLRHGGCTDWDYMVEMLADEEPFWSPGTRNGLHDQLRVDRRRLVRRTSGKSLGAFFRDEIAKPLGVEFWIGAPEDVEPRVAPMMLHAPKPGEPIGEFMMKMMTDPKSTQALSLLNSGGFDPNSRACHAAEIGGGGGISNARGLAGIYAPFARRARRRAPGRPQQLARMAEVSSPPTRTRRS